MRHVALTALIVACSFAAAKADPPWAEKLFTNGTTKDFSSIPRGTQLDHSFTLHNPYAVPLEVSAKSGCGCVTVKEANQTIEPRQDGKIEITMDAKKFTGPRKVTIHITVSAPNYFSSTELEVSANSRADVVLNPGQVNLGVVAQGQKSTPQTIDVEYAGALEWRVTDVVKGSAPLDVTYKEFYRNPGQVGYRVSVAAKADAPAGAIKHDLYLKTNDPESPLVPILVEGTVQASLSAAPNPVPFGTVKLGESVTKMIVVRGNKNKAFHITAIEGGGEGLMADLPADAKEVQIVRVKYQPTRTGDLQRKLRIKTDLNDQPAVTVEVQGSVVP
ncbi:MAG TPA: DUF1573 domain-containing protein [Gemmataceae bacterium]|jgi:hypothetical protein|nr:DUF1573 domain-containing protein [Gemmataceae bacterium]